MALEVARAAPGTLDAFFRATQREALKTFYGFSVIWHEQLYEFSAVDDGETVGAASIRVAASLAHVERVVVLPDRRRKGVGRALLDAAADAANYYNCHKMTLLVPHRSEAQRFFEACGYREEAVLPQHTFKLDMAAMRKFLL